MRRLVTLALLLTLPVLVVSCTYHRAHFDYTDLTETVPLRESEWAGEKLGPVAANDGGAIWNDCTKSSRGTIWHLVHQTRELGGNAIGEIRWLPKTEKHSSGDPTCKRAWAWLVLWPVATTKVFMSTRAEAYAYKVPEEALVGSGLYRIPEDPAEAERVVERILAENPARTAR